MRVFRTLAGMAYCLHTTENFREISNKLSTNSFNSPVIRTNKCLAKQDKVNCLPSVVWPLSQPEINLLSSTGKSRTNVSKPPEEQKREGKNWIHLNECTHIFKFLLTLWLEFQVRNQRKVKELSMRATCSPVKYIALTDNQSSRGLIDWLMIVSWVGRMNS